MQALEANNVITTMIVFYASRDAMRLSRSGELVKYFSVVAMDECPNSN